MDQQPHVKTIQVVMDEDLLRRVDKVALRLEVNRSALIREALRQHLRRLQMREREEADRRGYQSAPEEGELGPWSRVLSWPED